VRWVALPNGITKMDKYPEFIIIPYQVAFDKNLQPLDQKLYGIIYWITRLKNEKCFASNEILAELCNTSADTIRHSLARLEKSGYIQRIYADEQKKIRTEIIPLVTFNKGVGLGVGLNNPTGRTNWSDGVGSFSPQNNKIEKENLKINNIGLVKNQPLYKEESVEEIYPRLDKVVKSQVLKCSRCQRKIVGKPIIRGGKKFCKMCDFQDKELSKSKLKQEKKIKSIAVETMKKIMENRKDIGKLLFTHQERTKIQEEIALQERRAKNKKT